MPLSESNDTTIHVKNIQKLMNEFCKYLYGLLDPKMKGFFTKGILKYSLVITNIVYSYATVRSPKENYEIEMD